jgi:predicted nucleotidyltransferase
MRVAPRAGAWTCPTLDNRRGRHNHQIMTALTDVVVDSILSIIRSRRPAAKVVLYGSRARGDASPVSDIDLAVVDPSWTQDDIDQVHNRLEEEVPTALKMDLLALHLVRNADLVARIQREGIRIDE